LEQSGLYRRVLLSFLFGPSWSERSMRLAGDGQEEFFVLLTWAPRLLDTSSGRDAVEYRIFFALLPEDSHIHDSF